MSVGYVDLDLYRITARYEGDPKDFIFYYVGWYDELHAIAARIYYAHQEAGRNLIILGIEWLCDDILMDIAGDTP